MRLIYVYWSVKLEIHCWIIAPAPCAQSMFLLTTLWKVKIHKLTYLGQHNKIHKWSTNYWIHSGEVKKLKLMKYPGNTVQSCHITLSSVMLLADLACWLLTREFLGIATRGTAQWCRLLNETKYQDCLTSLSNCVDLSRLVGCLCENYYYKIKLINSRFSRPFRTYLT